MKRLIVITLILLAAAIAITVVYFKNLSPPGVRTGQVMHTIPDNATAVFEFNSEKGFYDIFKGNQLLSAVIGKDKLADLDTLRKLLITSPQLERFFDGQNVFISAHPSNGNDINLLITIPTTNDFKTDAFTNLNTQPNSGLSVTPIHNTVGTTYDVLVKAINKHFYITQKENNIFAGSFSKELIDQSLLYKDDKNRNIFIPLPEQQNANSLANLYINYNQLTPLFDQIFKNKNTDIFKSFKLLPALAALTLNFKNDALMFSGFTSIQHNHTASYLNLFADQQPVVNHLKDIFPSTTAYTINFAVSDPAKFSAGLSQWHIKAGISNEKDQLFSKIKAETGIFLKPEFEHLLSNEFAVVTTRYQEKYAIVSVKDGSKLRPIMMNISTMISDNIGQFNYDKVPFYLLGDAFSIFRKPYFMIIDNYLVLAATSSELTSYSDTYYNRKFISKTDQYNQFDNLQAERSNVAFFINFKNSQSILKRDLKDAFYDAFENSDPGWKSFYAASYQFSASDKNFYTNLCMRLNNTDSTATPIK
ncbi:hypothetical protein [Mucilaginibacter lappiensis]|uniref:DUF3352 domain-containing protein n=1 Tax=Mucilaginibacter lappiensis TaxID=354630 RepID=A0A1N7D4B1_9SPHI|nr:hypothetical protein [Mucilaginibacter lappiensis]MBB6111164.1 hypothetical protein [Mucilaginibacter lappiensis]MBB6128710.1 hypothetical protein [Mucilaginibacter lappiensis]SIR70594.1 hypothetical protein SAMN05421821_110183 [Mucilaginibacter lappiensis]